MTASNIRFNINTTTEFSNVSENEEILIQLTSCFTGLPGKRLLSRKGFVDVLLCLCNQIFRYHVQKC